MHSGTNRVQPAGIASELFVRNCFIEDAVVERGWGLQGLTNGVGPHGDLLREFPYVGPPHQSRVTKAPMKPK
jgi:hypothetical protein